MTSKEALECIKRAPGFMGGHSRYISVLDSRIPFLEDIEIVKQDLDKLERLEDDLDLLRYEHNSELGKNINLQEENTKLKKVIEILVDNLQLVLKQDIDPLLNRKVYIVELKEYYKKYTGFEIFQEEYELIKEVKENV